MASLMTVSFFPISGPSILSRCWKPSGDICMYLEQKLLSLIQILVHYKAIKILKTGYLLYYKFDNLVSNLYINMSNLKASLFLC